MKKKWVIALLGNWCRCLLSWALVHVFLADLYASLLGVSWTTSYRALTTLLVLLTSWRSWQIIRGKDEIAKRVDAWFDKKPGDER